MTAASSAMAAATETTPKDLRMRESSSTREMAAIHSTETACPVSMSFAPQSPNRLGPR